MAGAGRGADAGRSARTPGDADPRRSRADLRDGHAVAEIPPYRVPSHRGERRGSSFAPGYGRFGWCRAPGAAVGCDRGETSFMNGDAGLEVAGRLLIVAFFVIAGLCNLTPARIKDHIDRAIVAKTPFPTLMFWFGIALQFASCALV